MQTSAARAPEHVRSGGGPELRPASGWETKSPSSAVSPGMPAADQPGWSALAGIAGPRPRPQAGRDRSGAWLRNATAGLCVLAAASAAVSFAAQYRMVYAARRVAAVAGLEASIPDAAALIFASLGVALALHGKRAIRARVLNVAAVAASVFMNVLAAAPGWKALAIWAMPPVAYALASDTLIGVVRAWALARQRALNQRLADDEVTPLAILGGLLLWLLRLALAPASTLSGFRAWVVQECPVAPGRRPGARPPGQAVTAHRLPPAAPHPRPARGARAGTKTAAFLAQVTQRHGPLTGIPLSSVSRICTELAPQTELNVGAARTALRKAVLAAQEEDPR